MVSVSFGYGCFLMGRGVVVVIVIVIVVIIFLIIIFGSRVMVVVIIIVIEIVSEGFFNCFEKVFFFVVIL